MVKVKKQRPGIRFIREHAETDRYRLTGHAVTARLRRNITNAQLKSALLNGEIIEDYPDDEPYPSCLIFGMA
ncbi:DUF4258 domain-containing protein [Desulfococcaceae bacterium HSG8]|nr:DUF4258 domain-containing protein [Desulfococcaceae bacterium HSG8]